MKEAAPIHYSPVVYGNRPRRRLPPTGRDRRTIRLPIMLPRTVPMIKNQRATRYLDSGSYDQFVPGPIVSTFPSGV